MSIKRLLEEEQFLVQSSNNTYEFNAIRDLPKVKRYNLDQNGEIIFDKPIFADSIIDFKIYTTKAIRQPTVWWLSNYSADVKTASTYPLSTKEWRFDPNESPSWKGEIKKIGIMGLSSNETDYVELKFRLNHSIVRSHKVGGVSKKGVLLYPGQKLKINMSSSKNISFNLASLKEEGYVFVQSGKNQIYALLSSNKWKEYQMEVDTSEDLFFENVGGTPIYLSDLIEVEVEDLSEKPNILLIVIDSLRYDRVGNRGKQKSLTPTIDKLGDEGVRFERTYTQGTWTSPAFVSMLTGQYSNKHNPLNNELDSDSDIASISPDTPSFVKELKKNGYYCTGLHAGPVISHFKGFSELFDTYEDYTVENIGDPFLFAGEIGFNKVLKTISEKKKNNFVMLHLLDTHSPFGPPNFDVSNYNGDFKSVGWSTYLVGREKFFSNSDKEHVEKLYDSGVKYVDSLVSKLLKDLEKGGLLKNTIIILTSDHGEQLNDTEIWEHHHGHTVKEELTRVPLIVWGPSYVPKGKKVTSLRELKDIGTLILNLAGINRNDTFLYDNHYSDSKYAISLIGRYRNKASIIEQTPTGQLNKFVLSHGDDSPDELFFLKDDPFEKNNMVSENIYLARRLKKKLMEKLISESSHSIEVKVNEEGVCIIDGKTYIKFNLKEKIISKLAKIRVTNVRNLNGKTFWWNKEGDSEVLWDNKNGSFFIPAIDCPAACRFHIKIIDDHNHIYTGTCGGKGSLWELYGPTPDEHESLLWVKSDFINILDQISLDNIELWFNSFENEKKVKVDVHEVRNNKENFDIYFKPASKKSGLYTIHINTPKNKEHVNCFSQTYTSFTYPVQITLHTDASTLRIYSPFKRLKSIKVQDVNGRLCVDLSENDLNNSNRIIYNQNDGYYDIHLDKRLSSCEYDVSVNYKNGRFLNKRINGLNIHGGLGNEDQNNNVDIHLKELGYIE